MFFILCAVTSACRATPARPTDIQGQYVFAGAVAATLEISRADDHYVVALYGGGSRNAEGAAPADCYIRARGTLDDGRLDASFVGVEKETFLYSDTRARREARRVRIIFDAGDAEVTRADTDGYCGLGANFVGRYRRIR